MQEKIQKMDQLIASWRDEIFDMLRSWIAIESVKAERSAENAPFGENQRRMLDRFLKDAGKMGFRLDDVDGYAGSAEMGAGEHTMGILAHLDTVPLGDGWKHDPLGGEIENGRFYGRGAIDNKGPAVAALYAMRAVKEVGIPLRHAVRLIVGCDEETGMSDMAYYVQHRKCPDYGFSPDAEYPLINIEKGGLALCLSKVTGGEEGAHIPVYSLWAGVRRNVVPGTATAEVGTENVSFEELKEKLAVIQAAHEKFDLSLTDLGSHRARIDAVGAQSHAATPENGVNAAGMLLIALKELGAGGGSKTPIEALATLLGMAYDGEGLGIKQADELSGALTCNLGILRYDQNQISATLDIRYPLCADETLMCGNAAMALSPWSMGVARVGGHAPLHVPADSKVVKGLLKVYHEQTGLPAYPIAIGGGTYSRTMPNTVAFGINFPGDKDTCHMPDEYVDVEKLMLSVKMMAHAIVRLAGVRN